MEQNEHFYHGIMYTIFLVTVPSFVSVAMTIYPNKSYFKGKEFIWPISPDYSPPLWSS